MRFRIKKDNDGSIYFIVVSGEMDDEAAGEILQIAHIMLSRPLCRELVIDLRSVLIDDDLTVFTTDSLVSVFEEALLRKDSTLVVRFCDNSEIRLSSDQLPLTQPANVVDVSNTEAKFFSKPRKWMKSGARFLIN
jgi:anti-anti-sigma regulatory factor